MDCGSGAGAGFPEEPLPTPPPSTGALTLYREAQGGVQRAPKVVGLAGELPFIPDLHWRQLQDPRPGGVQVRFLQVQLSQAGGLLSATQTRRRHWPSGTERDEPFSGTVGAGEEETEGQSDLEVERKRKGTGGEEQTHSLRRVGPQACLPSLQNDLTTSLKLAKNV